MLEGLREALQYVVGLGNEAEKTEVVEICGKTYARGNLSRYDKPSYADVVKASTLTALVDYIGSCAAEFRGDMLVHIVSPTRVRFMIELQANFQPNDDLELVMKVAGNIERKNNQTFSDDGCTQTATMNVGIASKADVIVPNPVELIPYRTFQEVAQPASKFVFRIGDKEVPAFKIVEAEGGIWKNEAIRNIKDWLATMLESVDEEIQNRITIIG